jgi:hypothetical protein
LSPTLNDCEDSMKLSRDSSLPLTGQKRTLHTITDELKYQTVLLNIDLIPCPLESLVSLRRGVPEGSYARVGHLKVLHQPLRGRPVWY